MSRLRWPEMPVCKFELVGSLVQSKSPIHMTHIWIAETEKPIHWVSEHIHDYDEILIWTGSDPNNPRDLVAELYIDIEGERRTITSSGSILIPRWRRPTGESPINISYGLSVGDRPADGTFPRRVI